MSRPLPVEKAPLQSILLNPRFGVEQLKEDGSIKVRAVDHLSWSPPVEAQGERPSKRVCYCVLRG